MIAEFIHDHFQLVKRECLNNHELLIFISYLSSFSGCIVSGFSMQTLNY